MQVERENTYTGTWANRVAPTSSPGESKASHRCSGQHRSKQAVFKRPGEIDGWYMGEKILCWDCHETDETRSVQWSSGSGGCFVFFFLFK